MSETTSATGAAIDIEQFVDEHHKAVLDFLPADLMDLSDIPTGRERLAALGDAIPAPPLPDSVTMEVIDVPGHGADDPPVALRLYKPAAHAGAGASTAALYWIHGGGMVMGDAEMSDGECARWADMFDVVVASVDYRLAPEHPYPAAINDCLAGLAWFSASAAELGVSPERIVIGGASAGGGLAACLALKARDESGPAIHAQLLVYPMLDDRNQTASSHAIQDQRVWNRAANHSGWNAYLPDAAGSDGVSPYAAAARATDLAGLPQAYINVGTMDMFHDEDVAYAQALHQARVPVELHTYPGAFHASNKFCEGSDLSNRWTADEDAFLARVLAD